MTNSEDSLRDGPLGVITLWVSRLIQQSRPEQI